eukprot:TRINITY_DN3242_c0_g1_i9.p1 TRINITY_DN3242_c0_g1~~TRINITY_DN3242_c0_g1_i9.p1  ORF type:complete len:454 (-),score=46.82 TRINITY_DN3242_c0_g1_i9:146-1507(-)
MTHLVNKGPQDFYSQFYRFPSESIEVIGETGKDWTKDLPYYGEVEEESPDTYIPQMNSMQVPAISTIQPHIKKQQQMQVHIQKCLCKNRKLGNKIAGTLNLISKEEVARERRMGKREAKRCKVKMKVPRTREKTDTSGFLEMSSNRSVASSLSQDERHMMESNLATIEEAIISHVNEFSMDLHYIERLIACLEEYKEKIKKFIEGKQEFETRLSKFKRNLALCRNNQKQPRYLSKGFFGLAGNNSWSALKDYFTRLTPNLFENLQELSMDIEDFPTYFFLNMFAVNRLSAILRALKYCKDKAINFEAFQILIRSSPTKYLKTIGKHGSNTPSKEYPNKTEFAYLLSLKREEITNEFIRLCNMLLEKQSENILDCVQEEPLKMEIKRTSKRNHDLEERIRQRIASARAESGETEDARIASTYGKYVLILKKMKEETPDTNCRSTGYTDKKAVAA